MSEQLPIDCITISSKKIVGYEKAKDLLSLNCDELFVVDMDALQKGFMNFRVYYEISKFFEITVMNFPRRADDLIDTMISGANRTVIGDRLNEVKIREFMGISGDLVMYYGDIDAARIFSAEGGSMFLSSKEVNVNHTLIYFYGLMPPSGKYVQLRNFPADQF